MNNFLNCWAKAQLHRIHLPGSKAARQMMESLISSEGFSQIFITGVKVFGSL